MVNDGLIGMIMGWLVRDINGGDLPYGFLLHNYGKIHHFERENLVFWLGNLP